MMKKRPLGPRKGPRPEKRDRPKPNKDPNALSNRALREDLVLLACLEAYGAVRHDGRLADECRRRIRLCLAHHGQPRSQGIPSSGHGRRCGAAHAVLQDLNTVSFLFSVELELMELALTCR